MKKKLVFAAPVLLLVVAGAVYKLVLAKPPVAAEKRIEGTLVALDPEFVVNLAGGHYAKVSVAVVAEEVAAGEGSHGPGLEQDAAVRAAITDELTGRSQDELIDRVARKRLRKEILHHIEKTTDEHVTDVLLTDLTIQ